MEWLSPADPSKGHRYLYLSGDDYRSLVARTPPGTTLLKAERRVEAGGEERYVLSGGWVGGREGWVGGWVGGWGALPAWTQTCN